MIGACTRARSYSSSRLDRDLSRDLINTTMGTQLGNFKKLDSYFWEKLPRGGEGRVRKVPDYSLTTEYYIAFRRKVCLKFGNFP